MIVSIRIVYNDADSPALTRLRRMATPPCQISNPKWGRQRWRQGTSPHLVALHLRHT